MDGPRPVKGDPTFLFLKILMDLFPSSLYYYRISFCKHWEKGELVLRELQIVEQWAIDDDQTRQISIYCHPS